MVTVRPLSIVGCPSSAGSYAAGQEQAPSALRAAGLLDMLGSTRAVHDAEDLPIQILRPDRERPYAQNVEQVVANVQQLGDRLGPLLSRGDDVLVLGGNCTVVLGVLAALHRGEPGPPALLYVDRGYDLNVPPAQPMATWTGWAWPTHWTCLALSKNWPGHFDVRPLLRADQVA